MHKNNVMSINCIIYMMRDEVSYNSSLAILLLSALPSKRNDLKLQIREVILVKLICVRGYQIQHILIDDDDFDNGL
jgi:hypothetical protein